MALRYKIVVIDDDASIRSDLSALENSPECEVFAFGNLKDGMEKIRENPGINGLVLDAECKIFHKISSKSSSGYPKRF